MLGVINGAATTVDVGIAVGWLNTIGVSPVGFGVIVAPVAVAADDVEIGSFRSEKIRDKNPGVFTLVVFSVFLSRLIATPTPIKINRRTSIKIITFRACDIWLIV